MVRLTRTQLDLTTKTLLPDAREDGGDGRAAARSAADQLRVRGQPRLQRRRTSRPTRSGSTASPPASAPTRPASSTAPPSGNSTACLADRGQDASWARAFRGTLADAQLARYADLLHDQRRPQVGLPDATGDLVDVTLTSPSYVFRDEVLTDASAVLLPAQRLQTHELHAGRRAARDGRPVVGDAGRSLASARRCCQRPSTACSRRPRRAPSCCASSSPGSR